jgi:hypothetical protein
MRRCYTAKARAPGQFPAKRAFFIFLAQQVASRPSLSAKANGEAAMLTNHALVQTGDRQRLARDEVLAPICVRPPYFAFHDLVVDEWGIGGVVIPEEVMGREVGPISAAEAGRHLAILGSCAASRTVDSDGRHYYLAQQATLERLEVAPCGGGPLVARATARPEGRRQVWADATLYTGDGQPLYRLDVRYGVLPAPTFDRLFRAHRVARVASAPSAPYRVPLALAVVERSRTARAAVLDRVDPSSCAGHFDDVPALPVARVMGALSQVSIDLLAERLQEPTLRVSIVRAAITAERLAMAGTAIRFAAEHVDDAGAIQRLRSVASGPEGSIGTLEMEVEIR